MQQLSMPFPDKLDASLTEMCDQFASTARMPVVIRCERDALPYIVGQVIEYGGKVRREVATIGAIAAWLPLVALEKLTASDKVRSIELEQEFIIA